MSRQLKQLVYRDGFGARDEYETPLRGYRSDVLAELDDGSQYPLSFYDPIRLKQVLDDEVATGANFFAEVGLVILTEVTRENMERAARALCEEGYFEAFQRTHHKGGQGD